MTQEAELREYLTREILPPGDAGGIGDEDNLFERVSSMETIRLVAHIEKQYGIEVDDHEMIPENLGSIRLLAELIRRKKQVGTTITRFLNPVDRVMFHAHEVLRGLGFPGLVNQTYIELDGRVDVGKLRAAVEALGCRYLVVKSRIVSDAKGPCWSTPAAARCDLRMVQMRTDDEAESIGVSEDLLSTPLDLSRDPPLQFLLLRRPGGRDVLLVHQAHALTDAGATPLILEELNPHARQDVASDKQRRVEEQDGVRAHLAQFSRSQRVRAALYRLFDRAPLDGKTLTPIGPAPRQTKGRTRMAMRRFSPREATAFRAGLQRIKGLPSSSMALLASVFRVLERQCATDSVSLRLATTLGVNLRPQVGPAPIFQNMASVLRVSVPRKGMADRESLIHELNNQLRMRTVRGFDLGTLQLMALLLPRPLFLRRRLEKMVLESSVIYGFVKWRSSDVADVCGTPIANLFEATSTWAPPGLTITANEGFGTLCLMATYIEPALSRERVRQFLDAVVEDATG